MALVKLCGMTRHQDVVAASDAGADRVGLVVDFPPSPRSLSLSTAKELADASTVPITAVIVDKTAWFIDELVQALDPATIQLSGQETPVLVREIRRRHPHIELWKTIHLGPYPSADDVDAAVQASLEHWKAGVNAILVDAQTEKLPGGTGKRVNSQAVQALMNEVRSPIILAGGLTPDNVAEAITVLKPFGVDVSSGTEIKPGIKSKRLLRGFVAQAQRAFQST